ncbi:TPA: hypothetical protein ACH3X2_001533 [Trebouxia sp. C0005]
MQRLSDSTHTSASGLDAANAPDRAAQAGSAHHIQSRALGGFLSPLGKLAGMFGWAPGKSAEHFNAMPMSGGPPMASTYKDKDGHRQSGVGQQLAQLTRHANAPVTETQTSLPVHLLQIRPDQLTIYQLQNLQKAAYLLSPRSSAAWQLQTPSAPISSIASDKLAAVTRPALMPANDSLQQQATTSSNDNEGSLQRNYQRASTAGMDQASRAVHAVMQPGAMSYTESASQEEDDALAAALSSRLASMAPHPSSLCTDTLGVGSKRQHCSHFTRQSALHDDVCKRKQEEGPESAVQAIEKQCTRTSSTHSAEPVSSSIHGGVISVVPGSVQSMHNSLQLCQQGLPSHPRKKFRKTTGLEVLYRCMPSLLQNTSQTNS